MELYTMQQWEADRYLKVEQGQNIAPDVFFQLLNAVPPTFYEMGMFQCGEPYTHDWNTGLALYKTFKHVDTDAKGQPIYQYVGLMYDKNLKLK